MSNEVIKVENLSKMYRTGEIGTGTISHDLNRWWHKVRGLEDPYLKLGQTNDRTQKGSEYVWALNDINFSVKEGEVLGVIGQNGAGKSTLLKILSKITSPTKGRIHINGRIASLLEVGTGFHPEMTGRENAYMNGAILGMRRAEVKQKLDAIIDFAGIERYIDTPVKRYSSGMKVRLGFAVAAHLEPEILIVDEVLAVGDEDFQKKCIGKMQDVSKGAGRTILFVSHNIAAINKLCSRALLLKNGMLALDDLTQTVTGHYMSQSQSSDSIHFNEGYLRFISICQKEDALQLVCKFSANQLLQKPIIGFVIHDQNGQKLTGSNPIHQRSQQPIMPAQEGCITVNITAPKFLNGRYQLSVWFADEILGVLGSYEQVLSFQIMNMVKFDMEPNALVLGSVAASPEWIYTDVK